ncbi:MAG: HNH endonuclease [Anaerolineae bacterium]|nr:HNH endonuclease [Anaerolineae bacterium]
MADLKRCSKCKEEKPATPEYFRRNKNNKDGLSHQCKACFKAYEDKYIKRPEVREKRIAYMNEYNYKPGTRDRHNEMAQTPEYKAKQRELRQRPEQMAKDRARKLTPEARVRHRELEQSPEAKARRREQRQTPHGRMKQRSKSLQREARKRGLPADFTKADFERMMDYWGKCCAVCGRPAGEGLIIAADHWIPLTDQRADNPGTTIGNMVPLCHGQSGCNNQKRNADPVVWLNGRYGEESASEIMERIEAYFAWVQEAQQR